MIYVSSRVGYDKTESHERLGVDSAYHINVPDGWMHRKRFLDLSELLYVTEGELHLIIGRKEVTLRAGDIYIIRRYSAVSGSRPSKGSCRFYTVDFTCTIGKYDNMYDKIIHIPPRRSDAETLFENIALFGTGKCSDDYISDSSFALLLELLYSSSKSSEEHEKIRGILAYIDENISHHLTVGQIGRHFHYSGDYISRMFRQQLGITIKQYLTEKKLSVSKRLLTTSDISVKQVGASVGFSEQDLFEKFFRYHTGTTPKKYRSMYH